MSADALEAKFRANCLYGGWSAQEAEAALQVLRGVPGAKQVNLSALSH
jgi:hypothetical protein